jgi:hypothetical protein
MDAHSVPSLRELSEPLSQPDALPEGISLSVGLIATTPPAELRRAALDASDDHHKAVIHSQPFMTAAVEQSYANTRATIKRSYQKDLENAQNAAAEEQNVLGMANSVGFTPDADDLTNLFALGEQAQNAAAAIANTNDHPRVVEAREEMVEALAERAEATLEAPIAAAQIPLSNQIDKDVARLGRRGLLASTAAGLILGVSAALGFVVNHDGAQQPAPNATQAEQAHYENVASADRQGELMVAALGPLATGTAGFAVGAKLRGHFARRRARSMIRRAERA